MFLKMNIIHNLYFFQNIPQELLCPSDIFNKYYCMHLELAKDFILNAI